MLTCLMRLTLHVPGLLLPREILADTAGDLAIPALSLLLGRGRRAPQTSDWLPAQFGLAGLPAAAFRKLGVGESAAGEWLCLDPVHFDVRREGILLADPAVLDLATDEAAELRAALQPLFADWGEIAISAPTRWELRLARPLALATASLPESAGKPVDPALPGGADGKTWRALLAEAQTLLHAHPVNRRREALGRPTVSSLWPWGQGALPSAAQANLDAVWSADPVMAGLCALTGIPCLAPPAGFTPANGRVLVEISGLRLPAATHDALGWRAALLALEADWLAPAIAAMKERLCDALTVVGSTADGPPATVAFALERGDLRRFWRRPRPVTALA